MLDGQLEVLTGDERKTYQAGELAFVSAGTVHTFANRGPDSCRILVIMTPEVDELISALHSEGQAEDKSVVWARYNSSVVG